jgi:hypothetical protein
MEKALASSGYRGSIVSYVEMMDGPIYCRALLPLMISCDIDKEKGEREREKGRKGEKRKLLLAECQVKSCWNPVDSNCQLCDRWRLASS